MMILHIIPDEKWTQDFIDKINLLFDIKEHFFVVYTNKKVKYCKDRKSTRLNSSH